MRTPIVRAASIVFIASFCTLVIELVAGRVLAPHVGVSLYIGRVRNTGHSGRHRGRAHRRGVLEVLTESAATDIIISGTHCQLPSVPMSSQYDAATLSGNIVANPANTGYVATHAERGVSRSSPPPSLPPIPPDAQTQQVTMTATNTLIRAGSTRISQNVTAGPLVQITEPRRATVRYGAGTIGGLAAMQTLTANRTTIDAATTSGVVDASRFMTRDEAAASAPAIHTRCAMRTLRTKRNVRIAHGGSRRSLQASA